MAFNLSRVGSLLEFSNLERTVKIAVDAMERSMVRNGAIREHLSQICGVVQQLVAVRDQLDTQVIALCGQLCTAQHLLNEGASRRRCSIPGLL